MNKNIFKAYDVRGVYPGEIDEEAVYKIAKAFCKFLKPKKIVIGCDVRMSSPSLKKIAIQAVTEENIEIADVGTISTDMLYFAVANYGYDGGFSITASHNPKEYNGIKFVREKARPISADTGLFEIRDMAFNLETQNAKRETNNHKINNNLVKKLDILDDYIKKIKTFADFSKIKPFKIVINPNFGVVGPVVGKLLAGTGIKIIKLNDTPDGTFPKGRPDPSRPETRKETTELIKKEKADLGVAWDADADRCFFFTEKGEFIEGYFITALLGKLFLEKKPGSTIIHDISLTWAVEDLIKENGGKTVATRPGHAFIKEEMHQHQAIFGGEKSAHYYFKDYYYADCGMIPLVILLEFLSGQNKKLSEIMEEMFWKKYFVSGEINNEVPDTQKIINKVKKIYLKKSPSAISEIDGLAIDFENKKTPLESWRFSLRASNTEPLLRLNVEAKNEKLMQKKRDELLKLIK